MSAKTKSGNNSKKILVVEDSPTQAEQLKYILENEGYAVLTAGDGKEALSILQKNRPTIIITDIVMPEMDGYELCRQIKSRSDMSDIPVILLTKLSDTVDVIKGMQCGANNFVTKPYNPDYLLAHLRYILANRESRSSMNIEMGVNITIGGEKFFITSDRMQILDFLISTYEAAIQQGRELAKAQEELREINDHLEDKVRERTADLLESEEKYRLLIESASEGVVLIQDGLIRFTNASFGNIVGFPDLIANPFIDIIHSDERQIVQDYINKSAIEFSAEKFVTRIVDKNGNIRWIDIGMAPVAWESRPAALLFVTDTTERKEAEDNVRRLNIMLLTIRKVNQLIVEVEDENELLQKVCETLADGRSYKLARIGFVKKGSYEIQPIAQAGFAPNFIESLTVTWDDTVYGRNPADIAIKTGKTVVIQDVSVDEADSPRRDKALQCGIASEVALPLTVRGKVIGMLAVYSEKKGVFNEDEIGLLEELSGDISLGITKIRQRVETERAEAKYAALVNNSNDGIIVLQDALVKFSSKHMEEMTGFTEAEYLNKPFIEFVELRYREQVMNLYKQRLSGEAVHERYEIELLTKDSRNLPVEINASIIEYEGKLANMAIIRDITERKVAEEKIKQGYEQLQKMLDGTIQFIAATVELRDPYTAGHQIKVARLAKAIGSEMNLTKQHMNQIYTAGIIHDIGKISVPSEILSKPGQLNSLEFSLIKVHSQAGFDALRNIEFPYNVAQWVLEHHERMNGTGYPSGLQGDKISLEAKILAVADVVEAMASHRPYRAALGLEAALAEISDNRNVLYDGQVVDACLRLFREKGFKFE